MDTVCGRQRFSRSVSAQDSRTTRSVTTIKHPELPKGTHIIGAFPHGASYWARTAEIQTEQADGSLESFFIKVINASHLGISFALGIFQDNVVRDEQVAQGDIGKAMVSGEFYSMTTMHQVIPDSTPAPIAWGTYASDPDIHFFLCRFVNVIDEVPDVETFTVKVAELHAQSSSPNGKYGFPVPTYMGRMAQYHTWTESWEEFFTLSMESLMMTIDESQAPDEELKELFGRTMSMVVPRLLRPLETGGRQIKPSLVHGNLYSGNVSVDVETGRPVLYDATCLYAHNECKTSTLNAILHR